MFGRFGKNNPEQSIVSPADRRQNSKLSQSEIDNRDFPIASNFDDDEETNWDDAETLADENNPVVYSQPIVPVVAPPAPTIPDLEEWDEALPAATVKNSNVQEARRGKKKPAPVFKTEDIWGDDIPKRTFSANDDFNPEPVPPDPVARSMGFWSDILQQFRRFLPAPIRQLSDAILTAILVMLVTITIWFVDGFFVPTSTPSVANPPSATVPESPKVSPAPPTAVESAPPTPAVVSTPKISPEQAFIEAIETQLSEITSQYPDDIIQTLSIDLAHDRAIVRLNPVWYTLDEQRQNSLADRMWQQAQANHFTKLELQDDRGVSIARSPVVGKHAIILQRQRS
jgi:hypothetical protein